jgi:predicted phage terminase large subunit-like protein
VDNQVLKAVLRNNFQAFSERAFATLNPSDDYQDNWSIRVVAHHLNRCAKREIRRLIILVPPRSLKSHMATVAYPAYLLGQDPSTRIIAASYGNDLAIKFSNDTRTIIKSDWYRNLFPATIISPDKDTQTLFQTTRHGLRYSTSVDGALTGLGADFIIVDDPLKASEATSESARTRGNNWFDNTVLSRLNDPKHGVVIVVMQRLHVDDLAGHLIEQGGWTILRMPARAEVDIDYEIDYGKIHTFKAGELLHPARLGQKELDERRRTMGTAAFYAQYMQDPVPPAGNLFNWAWFRPYDDSHPEFSELFLSVDVAATAGAGNYSAFTVWGHRDSIWYFVAAYRAQLELPNVREKLLQLDRQYRPDLVVVDGIGIGRGLIQELRMQGFKHITWSNSKGKEVDAQSVAPMVEAGRVRVPDIAPGLDDFRNEVVAFPNGKYCDQVDSMVQLLRNARNAVNLASRFKRTERRSVKSSGRLSVKIVKIPSANRHYGF